jgi:mannose-1-phosphate guanylyltransferase
MRWAVLLAGGSGTRFWPLSTPENPKQLLPLTGPGSSAQDSVERLAGLIPRERTLVVAGAGLAHRLQERLQLPRENMLVEPHAASTAPALIWATWEAQRRDPEAEVLSLHADWAVGDAGAFRETAGQAGDRGYGPVAPRHGLRLHRPRSPAG